MTDDDLYRLAETVGAALARQGARLATAESCTGGWVAQCLTDIPGSSGWFERGFVTYSNESKQELLGVPEHILLTHGAVSEATVLAMAAGALSASRADCAVAVSGIAGPSGGSPDKPLGTVWIAWQVRDREGFATRHRFAGNRREVRRQAVREALSGLLELYAV